MGRSGLGGSANVTFSFPVSFTVGSSGPHSSGAFGYTGEPQESGQALNAAQISVVRDAMHKWSRVATLNCSEVVDSADTAWDGGDNSSVGDILLRDVESTIYGLGLLSGAG